MLDDEDWDSVLCVIPARYGSTRFPGKPLAPIAGVPMIVRVAQIAASVLDHVVIATDDQRIADVCEQLDMEVRLTSGNHPTGTDRVAEVSAALDCSVVINLQGDEPLLRPSTLKAFIAQARKQPAPVANAAAPLGSRQVDDETVPKVVVNLRDELVYISRSPIPNVSRSRLQGQEPFLRQLGLYAYTRNALQEFANAVSRGRLDRLEDIEILRFLDLGVPVRMIRLPADGPAVDLPSHVPMVERYLEARTELEEGAERTRTQDQVENRAR